jgi:hypothetical protein
MWLTNLYSTEEVEAVGSAWKHKRGNFVARNMSSVIEEASPLVLHFRLTGITISTLVQTALGQKNLADIDSYSLSLLMALHM